MPCIALHNRSAQLETREIDHLTVVSVTNGSGRALVDALLGAIPVQGRDRVESCLTCRDRKALELKERSNADGEVDIE